MSLWVPPKVERRLQEETAEYNAVTLGMFDFHNPVLDKWNDELQKIDPYLRLGRARPRADAFGVIPNFYHLVRINPGAPLWIQPLHANGKFVEPTSRMLDRLREADLQNAAVVRARKEAERKQQEQEEKQKEEGHERRVDEMVELWKARTQTRIPFHTDSKWSQNVAGRRGIKR